MFRVLLTGSASIFTLGLIIGLGAIAISAFSGAVHPDLIMAAGISAVCLAAIGACVFITTTLAMKSRMAVPIASLVLIELCAALAGTVPFIALNGLVGLSFYLWDRRRRRGTTSRGFPPPNQSRLPQWRV